MRTTVLRTRDGCPTVYLVDEYHNCDLCTDASVRAARELFDRGVAIAGVEGYEGGRCFDAYDDTYVDKRVQADLTEATRIGKYPRFASALASEGLLVVGVDCRGLADKIETDIYDGTWTGSVSEHPNQRRRSEHFVRTLAEEALDRRVAGDWLLNAGAEHIDRIAEMLNAVALPDGWPDYQFVRLRCSEFEDCRALTAAPAA